MEPTPTTSKRPFRLSSKTKRYLSLWLFIIPALLIILVVQLYPLIYSLVVSFMHWSLMDSDRPYGFTLINYISVLKNPMFLYSCKISAMFMVVTTFSEVIIGFILAYALKENSTFVKMSRTILIIPMTIAPVASGIMWRMFLDGNSGLLNSLLEFIGIKGPNWLGDPNFALWGCMIVDVWLWTPFAMIIFVASLNSISSEWFEAGRVDGATKLGIIRHIVIPMVTPASILILTFRLIDTFFVFDQIYTLTYGGPGTSTQVVSLYIYNQGLKYFNISHAAAASWITMIVAMVIAALLLKLKSLAEKSVY
jgi:ABC-type sugar transport systems, permease components